MVKKKVTKTTKKKATKQLKKPVKAKVMKAKAPKVAKKSQKNSKKQKAVSPENYFFTADGRIIKNLIQLADTLDGITDEVFFHHVTDERNDFSNWIREVLEEPRLADQMVEIKDPMRTQVVVLKFLVKKRGR